MFRCEEELTLSRGKVIELTRRNIDLINELNECQEANNAKLYIIRQLEAAIKKAVEDEREACAKAAECEPLEDTSGNVLDILQYNIACRDIAKTIRQRSTQN